MRNKEYYMLSLANIKECHNMLKNINCGFCHKILKLEHNKIKKHKCTYIT